MRADHLSEEHRPPFIIQDDFLETAFEPGGSRSDDFASR